MTEGLKPRRIVDREGNEALVDSATDALKVLAIPSGTAGGVQLYAWTGAAWVKVLCDATGKLQVTST